MKEIILICSCHSLEHQIMFWYDEDDKMLYAEVHLAKHGLLRRIQYALRYIFGYKCRFGAFDEFLFDSDNEKQLFEFFKNK